MDNKHISRRVLSLASVAALDLLPERRRRRRISITAGEESEANVTCGSNASLYDVLEEGEHKQTVQIFHMFALFEDDLTIFL